MTVRVRIAPSPTGNLHIGTARTAVFNWLYGRHHQGTFILRIEDTDQERSRSDYTENIISGLKWLGLDWDEGPFFQTQRLEHYEAAVQTLLDAGLAYYCYCTPAELDDLRARQKAKGQAPRYDNRHRNLTPEQQSAFDAEGREPVIRFKIEDDRQIQWTDLVRGTVTWKGADLGGDMVISRAAPRGTIGIPLYNLVVVVDDIAMGITDVIRGEDHIGNTPKQILLYEALGAPLPNFGHTPLILNTSGQKLSKRDGVTSISDFQEMGYLAEALTNYMTLLGWSPPEELSEIFNLSAAAAVFSFDRVNKAGAKFDWDKLNWLNSQYLHQMPLPQLLDHLIRVWQGAGYDFDPTGDRPWLESLTALLQPSLVKLTDAIAQGRLFFNEPPSMDGEAISQLNQSGSDEVLTQLLHGRQSEGQLTPETAKSLINHATKAVGVKKGLTMRTLRAALTGAIHGPDLIETWLILHQRRWDIPRLERAISLYSNSN
ncbi:glutamate--tRNA ligase [Candidatus Synechococcus calcipolaris G9]|uniref:Glutamate--tRNA ligase n=1 Tax=Candidatus Synechococcus calcipolaris G9 TaxID=1497997 RepID=A0ABT6EV93_9SYNE|nr:glutamate--tRNA ligase [Candidatus Synechococcus calcipolaris]MDG2989744.1 glutamate--tRNA ligase [Candidatus Synechococcus calcipolaris G9]